MNAKDIQQKYPPKTKNELKKISDRWDTLWEAHSDLTSWGSLGESAELNPRESDRDGEGAKVYNNQYSEFGQLPSCLQWGPSREPSKQLCPSAEVSWWPLLARELSW